MCSSLRVRMQNRFTIADVSMKPYLLRLYTLQRDRRTHNLVNVYNSGHLIVTQNISIVQCTGFGIIQTNKNDNNQENQ